MNQDRSSENWSLLLYIAGMTLTAERARENIEKICRERLDGKYSIEIIDLLQRPGLAESEQIFAVPTLVRQVPLPLRKLIGDLADSEKVLIGLDLQSVLRK
jgi:circadian clock protein KaiB